MSANSHIHAMCPSRNHVKVNSNEKSCNSMNIHWIWSLLADLIEKVSLWLTTRDVDQELLTKLRQKFAPQVAALKRQRVVVDEAAACESSCFILGRRCSNKPGYTSAKKYSSGETQQNTLSAHTSCAVLSLISPKLDTTTRYSFLSVSWHFLMCNFVSRRRLWFMCRRWNNQQNKEICIKTGWHFSYRFLSVFVLHEVKCFILRFYVMLFMHNSTNSKWKTENKQKTKWLKKRLN